MNESHFTLRARCVLPVGAPPIDGGRVVVRDGRIESVGGRDSVGELLDLGDVVLAPALVNAHTHLEFSGRATPIGRPGMSLPEWLAAAVAARSDEPDAANALQAGAAECRRFGVGAVGEIAQGPESAAALTGAGLAGVAYWEARGLAAGRADDLLRGAQRHLDGGASGPVAAGLSPHAPYSVHAQSVARLAALACRSGAPLAMHLAECREEQEFLATGQGPFRELLDQLGARAPERPVGTTTLDYLWMLAVAGRSAVVHGNYLTEADVDYLAQKRDRFAVVYCPRTHAYFAHEPHPAPRLLAQGIRVALGTDSRASSPDLNVLADLQAAATAHPDVAPAAWLRAATLDAAWTLGLEEEAGDLAAGRRAVFAAFPFAGGDPYRAILQAAAATGLFDRQDAAQLANG